MSRALLSVMSALVLVISYFFLAGVPANFPTLL